MMRMNLHKKKRGQAGFIVTAELLLITVILAIGLVTGMTKLRDQTIAELSDTGSAIGAINQSYEVFGTAWVDSTSWVAITSGWEFLDAADLSGSAAGGEVGGDTQLVTYGSAPIPSTSIDGTGEDTPQY